MNFSDEVDAARSAKTETDAQRRELETQLRGRFDAEVTELWHLAEQYWSDNAERIESRFAEYITTGKFATAREMVAYPLLPLTVTKERRSRSEWATGAVTLSDSVIGINIRGWFALCNPGQVRELQDRYEVVGTIPLGLMRVEQSHLQISSAAAESLSDGYEAPAFRMGFAGPPGKPDVVLRCALKGPIEVFTHSAAGWEPQGPLRQLVVLALAEAFDKRKTRLG